MLNFLACWCWGFVLLGSFCGWGWLVGRTLFKNRVIDPGQKICWGLSVLIVIGGFLNLFALIYKSILLSLVGIGLFLFFVDVILSRKILFGYIGKLRVLMSNKLILLGLFLVVMIAGVKYTRSVYSNEFNIHDDYHSYLVFPEKMIQTHTLGQDPFNTRQMTASLGGASFLQTLILCMFPLDFICCMDEGVGLLIIVLLLLFYREGGDLFGCRLFLVFILLATPLLFLFKANVTSLLIPIALFLCLFRAYEGDLFCPQHYIRNAIIVSLVVSALCTLKSSNIIALGCFCVFGYRVRFIKTKARKQIIVEFGIVAILIGMMLLPWMLQMYHSCGTLFYPILGQGYYASSYSDFSHFDTSWNGIAVLYIFKLLINTCFISFLILSILFLKDTQKKLSNQLYLVYFVISVFVGILGIGYATKAFAVTRFSSSFMYAGILLLLANILRNWRKGRDFRWAIALFISGILVGGGLNNAKDYIFNMGSRLKGAKQAKSILTEDDQSRAVQLQEVVPESEILMARLQKPFVLDFERQPIYVIDFPGESSPPPGLPFAQGPESVAEYLVGHSVRYIAYSYQAEAGYSKERFKVRLSSSTHAWIRFEAERTFDFQDNLNRLIQTRKRLYDDGEICVIDLLEKQAN